MDSESVHGVLWMVFCVVLVHLPINLLLLYTANSNPAGDTPRLRKRTASLSDCPRARLPEGRAVPMPLNGLAREACLFAPRAPCGLGCSLQLALRALGARSRVRLPRRALPSFAGRLAQTIIGNFGSMRVESYILTVRSRRRPHSTPAPQRQPGRIPVLRPLVDQNPGRRLRLGCARRHWANCL